MIKVAIEFKSFQLYAYYVSRAHDIAFSYERNPVNWEVRLGLLSLAVDNFLTPHTQQQEVFNYFGTSLDNRTIIQVWLDFNTLSEVRMYDW